MAGFSVSALVALYVSSATSGHLPVLPFVSFNMLLCYCFVLIMYGYMFITVESTCFYLTQSLHCVLSFYACILFIILSFFRRLLEAFRPWLFGDDIIASVHPNMCYTVIDVVKINK